MLDNKKQNISVRMNSGDLQRIKEIAKRMHVRESDVFRFAVKNTLAKLAPLYDPQVRGKDLVPVFADSGSDLTSYFELDTACLEKIINSGVDDPDKRVAREDIELLAMAGIQDSYVYMRLNQIFRKQSGLQAVSGALREYLLDKYMDGSGGKEPDELKKSA
jgi:hypothetical protein